MSDQREAILTASLKRLAAMRDKAQAVGDQSLWWQVICYMQVLLDNDYRERKGER